MCDKILFVSLNYHSYKNNTKIIDCLVGGNLVRHIVVIDQKQYWHDYTDVELFEYTSLLSQFKLYIMLFSFLFSSGFQAVVVPHYDLPIIRLLVSLSSNKKSQLFVIPDGVMFPSDIDFRDKRVGCKFSFLKLKVYPNFLYSFLNRLLSVFIKNREHLYNSSYVVGFGTYFWEYYKLLGVKKEKYFPIGNPMFDNVSAVDVSSDEKHGVVTFFLQPFVEEKWIKMDKFISTVNDVINIFHNYQCKLKIKLHPRQELRKYLELFPDKLNSEFIEFISNTDNIELIKKSDFIMSYNSTVICDAILLRKGVVVFDLFEFNRKNEFSDVLHLKSISNKKELEVLLNQYYTDNVELLNIEGDMSLDFFLTKEFESANKIALFIKKKIVVG